MPSPSAPPASPGRVLVIDDDAHFLELVVMILSFDHHVSYAGTGAEALRLIRLQPFDLVCTDYDLPDMTGLQILRELAAVAPGTSGLLITGTDYLKSKYSGGHPVLIKPFPPEELLTVSEQLVEAARMRRQ